MRNKIVIIGGGNVGVTILHTLMMDKKNEFDLFLIDNHLERAKGNVEDLRHCLNDNMTVNVGSYSDLEDADILIIASGVKNLKNRTKFLKKSYLMIKEIVDNIKKFNFTGNIIIVSNPNDVLTTYVAKNYYNSDLVIGTGTILDTNRLKYYLSNQEHISINSINDYVIGEHGLNQQIIWHNKSLSKDTKRILSEKVKNISYEIVSQKGYTNFAIANCVDYIIKVLMKKEDENKVIISSLDKEIGVAYSVPAKIINRKVIRLVDKIDFNILKPSITNIKNEYKIFSNCKTIGIDLDDTITYLQDYMLDEAYKYDQQIGGKGIIHKDKYLIGEKFGWSDAQKDVFFKKYRLNAIKKAKIRPYVKSTLKKFINLGYEIIIITARSSKYYSNPYEYTKKWLNDNQIPYNRLIVDCKSKKEICLREHVDIFVDDMPDNCNSVLEIGSIDVYMMDNGNNIANCKKIKDFKELYFEVLKNE